MVYGSVLVRGLTIKQYKYFPLTHHDGLNFDTPFPFGLETLVFMLGIIVCLTGTIIILKQDEILGYSVAALVTVNLIIQFQFPYKP